MGDRAAEAPRYKAFLSYSHKDAAAAARLHKALEGYRLPKRLVGRAVEHGPVPQRLLPIFRDRDELPASSDLSERVRAALAQSGALIVLCSPDAAASRWVASEVETFRALHPQRPVLAAIVAGEPPGCFPAPLRLAGLDGAPREPLATDLRREGDGPRLGLLKLVAGLTGVGLDELVQRDASRRVRRVTAVTAVALAAMLIMALLTVVALAARREADRQRAEAEGLIEFMLTDLRQRLKGVGRIDIMTAANNRALAYYDRQDTLSPRNAAMRARVLHAIGEDDLARGHPGRALLRFQEANSATRSLLDRVPSNADVIFAHAQGEYWLGFWQYRQRRFDGTRASWQRYRDLTQRLVAQAPGRPEWIREAGYAEGNLCTLALVEPIDAREAQRACAAALARIEQVHRIRPRDNSVILDLANRHAWMADVWNYLGRWEDVLHHRRKQEELARRLVALAPSNLDFQDFWMRTHFSFGQLLEGHGDLRMARASFKEAARIARLLRNRDPDNAEWHRFDRLITEALNRRPG